MACRLCDDQANYVAVKVLELINAVYNESSMIQIILDNSATAMTGFQSHPGTGFNAVGDPAKRIDIEKLCRSLGCEVMISDPFDIRGTVKVVREALREDGVKVLVLKRACEIVRMKEVKSKPFLVQIDETKCKGEECGICSSNFICPALYEDQETGKAKLKEDICCGCGVCVEICPFDSIIREEIA